MSTLLSLPPELLDEILDLVLFAPLRFPHSPPSLSDRTTITRHTTANYHLKTLGYKSQLAKFLPHPTSSAATPLLLVNRHLNQATTSILERASSTHGSPTTYHLDIVFLDEWHVVPTWLRVPRVPAFKQSADPDAGSSPRHVARLNATVRAIGACGTTPHGSSGFKGGDSGPRPWIWGFYALLQHFFMCGAGLNGIAAEERQPSIGVLDINVVDDESNTNSGEAAGSESEGGVLASADTRWSTWLVARRNEEFGDAELRKRVIRAEWLANQLLAFYAHLLGMGGSKGRRIYERIGNCVFRVNGRIIGETNMSEFDRRMERMERPRDEVTDSWPWVVSEQRKKRNLVRHNKSSTPFADTTFVAEGGDLGNVKMGLNAGGLVIHWDDPLLDSGG